MSEDLRHDGPREVALEHDDIAVPLFDTERLNPQEASRLLARAPGRLVIWVGEQGAAKTTLCIELYEAQRRAGASQRFAGSWTLLALEQLAHRRRATAGTEPSSPFHAAPDLDGREILHLALSQGDAPVHLLFADLPGEIFSKLADNQISAAEIPSLGRADKLALLVDGGRVSDPAMRATVSTRVRQLVERLRSSGLPTPGCGLALVVTKWDLVLDDPSAVAYWHEREADLLAEVRSLDAGAPLLRVGIGAPTWHYGDGIAALRAWLLDSERVETPPIDPAVLAAGQRGLPRLDQPQRQVLVTEQPPIDPPAREPRLAGPPPLEPRVTEPSVRDQPATETALDQPTVLGFEWNRQPRRRLRLPWRAGR